MAVGTRRPERAGPAGDATLFTEHLRLLTGAGEYVGDVRVAGCLDAAFVRAGVAHGEIRRVDVSAARRVPGVVGAWAAGDLRLPPVPPSEGSLSVEWPSLARDRVCYAGEAVAVVVADDRYRAEDGADAVVVEIDPLPVRLDPTAAAESRGGRDVVFEREFGNGVPARVWEEAATVVVGSYHSQLLSVCSIEARALLARPEPDGTLTVWCSHQAAHHLRALLATALGLDEERVRVVVPDVGGAFGGKSQIYPEYIVVTALAQQLGRPVRWLEDRREALTSASTGRGQNQHVRMAADNDGKILAIEARLDAAVGGYPHLGAMIPVNTAQMICGNYAIPHAAVHVRAVVTNHAPMAAYRGAGRPEATFAVERTVERLARTLGIDSVELRRRNFVREFPYTTATGWLYDSGDYDAVLDRALALAEVDRFRAEQERRRGEPASHPLGIGICCYVERSGGAAGGTEFGSVEALTTGGFVARSGSCPSGQSQATTFAALVADVLGVDSTRVAVVQGDTAEIREGEGTYGSRSLQVGGSVLYRAARGLIAQARERAATAWGVGGEQVSYDGGVLRAGTRETTIAALAGDAPLVCEGEFAAAQAFPFGCYVAVVEIDPELGVVEVLRLVGVDDVGRILNPPVVEGQRRGSLVQGLGQALYEEVVHDADGIPAARTLLDYLLPTVSELPAEVLLAETVTPNPNTPLGTKGAGEIGAIAVPPAIVNAVADALALAPEHESLLTMPLTPERVWRALAVSPTGASVSGH